MVRLQADIADVVFHALFFTSLMFIPAVSLFWHWWEHPYGRAAVSLEGLLFLALVPGELSLLFHVSPVSPWFAWFTIAILALIPVRTVWLGWQIWKLQRTGSRPVTGSRR